MLNKSAQLFLCCHFIICWTKDTTSRWIWITCHSRPWQRNIAIHVLKSILTQCIILPQEIFNDFQIMSLIILRIWWRCISRHRWNHWEVFAFKIHATFSFYITIDYKFTYVFVALNIWFILWVIILHSENRYVWKFSYI